MGVSSVVARVPRAVVARVAIVGSADVVVPEVQCVCREDCRAVADSTQVLDRGAPDLGEDGEIGDGLVVDQDRRGAVGASIGIGGVQRSLCRSVAGEATSLPLRQRADLGVHADDRLDAYIFIDHGVPDQPEECEEQ